MTDTTTAETTNPHQPTFRHSPEGVTYGADCTAPDCGVAVFSGGFDDERYAALFKRSHSDQYEPGRAPDITVDWVISADCSVCEDGGDIDTEDGESVICKDCGTTWGMTGENGERDA